MIGWKIPFRLPSKKTKRAQASRRGRCSGLVRLWACKALIGLWLYQPETFPVLDEALIFFCMEEKTQTSETIQLSFSACTASYKYCSFLQRGKRHIQFVYLFATDWSLGPCEWGYSSYLQPLAVLIFSKMTSSYQVVASKSRGLCNWDISKLANHRISTIASYPNIVNSSF